MSKHGGKNPFVHSKDLPDGRHMLNTVGNDGWSYDEPDDVVVDDEYDRFTDERAAKANQYLNFDDYADEKDLNEFE